MKMPIHSTNAPRPLGPYSQAIAIDGMAYDDIVKTTVFLTEIEDYFETFDTVYSTFFPNKPPARTTVAVKALPRGSMVVIDAVGVRNAVSRSS